MQDQVIPRELTFQTNQHGMVEAHLSNEHGACRVSLYGGQVLDCHLKAGGALLWLSPKAIYQAGTAIRGGIPLVFPWFGSQAVPAHGFARLSVWEVVSTTPGTAITLRLTDDDHTRKFWPHAFTANLTIRLDAQGLSLELGVTNSGQSSWTWSGGFHPYFRVADLASTTVRGLDPANYIDLLDGKTKEQTGPIEFGGPLDRKYLAAPPEVVISGHRELIINQQGADGHIVWNPGLGHPKADMPDSGPDEFICVEPARLSEPQTLGPGQFTKLSMRAHIKSRQ